MEEKVIRQLIKYLGQPHTVLAMALEGTRSRDGKMRKAEEGVGVFVNKARRTGVLIIPMGIVGSEGIHRVDSRLINPFHKVKVMIGKPRTSSELIREAEELSLKLHDIVMLHIAILLPKQYRGYYGQKNFPEFYEYIAERGELGNE